MSDKPQYWRISPGEEGSLWREQKLNGCIAIGWSETGSAEGRHKEWLRDRLNRLKWPGKRAYDQLSQFIWDVKKHDKIVASTSGNGVYAVGTIIGDYQFDENLTYKHSRKVQWETTFWDPLPMKSLNLEDSPYFYKFHGRNSWTIRELGAGEWIDFSEKLNKVQTPFRNLGLWGGMIQAPEYENEVMILFSHMLQHFRMRIIQFATRFPDAIVEQKKGNRWEKVNVEFELRSSGFRCHLSNTRCQKNSCVIVCWEDDDWGKQESLKKYFEIIELKKHLIEIL